MEHDCVDDLCSAQEVRKQPLHVFNRVLARMCLRVFFLNVLESGFAVADQLTHLV